MDENDSEKVGTSVFLNSTCFTMFYVNMMNMIFSLPFVYLLDYFPTFL